MLGPVIPKDHCTEDSISFCKEIKKVSSTNKFLVSYDLCSLFTSIPLNETIDLAAKLIFDNNPNIKITERDLKKLFDFTPYSNTIAAVLNPSFLLKFLPFKG